MTTSTVLIAGCGYLGTRLGHAWIQRGAQVYGLRRSSGGPRALPMPDGMIQIRADLTRPETMRPLPAVDWVVLCQAPGPNDDYKKTYQLGTKNLLAAISGSPRILMISSTSVYSTQDGSWVDESSDPHVPGYPVADAAEHADILLKTEELVLKSSASGNVIRSSGIYGPYRNRLSPIREGRFVPELCEEFTNRIRVEDLVSAILTVVDKGKPGERYIATDDTPSTQREFYEWLYPKMGLALPAGGADSLRRGGNKRCRNEKLKALGWKPHYPSFKEGYADLLASGN